jgi:hypothetical protein
MSTPGRSTNIPAVGMRSGAVSGPDVFDMKAAPPPSENAAFNIVDELGYSRNFVSPLEDFTWSYYIHAPLHSEVTLEWDNNIVRALPENIYLYVHKTRSTYNMRSINTLNIPANAPVQVIYGDEIDPATLNMLTLAYPNPTSDHVTLQFFVESSYPETEVKLSIYGIDGRQVLVRSSRFISNQMATYEFTGLNLPSGIYLYQVSYDNRNSELKKLIIR